MGNSGGHFYRREDGAPCYEIVGANGRPRPPTIRDARQGIRGLMKPFEIVPSVTTILHGLGSPRPLVNWLVRTALECAATNPPRAGEGADEYAARLEEDADRWRQTAASVGTQVHDCLERRCTSLIHQAPEPDIAPYVYPAIRWLEDNVAQPILAEYSFASGVYGGKLDLYAELRDGRRALIDFKTQGTSERYGHTTRTYDEWGEQLVAYQMGSGLRTDVLANLVISSTKPGVVEWHEWDAEELPRLAGQWLCKLEYYQLSQNWWPNGRQNARF